MINVNPIPYVHIYAEKDPYRGIKDAPCPMKWAFAIRVFRLCFKILRRPRGFKLDFYLDKVSYRCAS